MTHKRGIQLQRQVKPVAQSACESVYQTAGFVE
jgi:hypothetical protein